jgi:hypothetical protein
VVQKQINVQCVELAQERHEVLQAATQAVDAPGHDDIELAARRSLAEGIELRTLVPALGVEAATSGAWISPA